MSISTEHRYILVTRKSRLEELIERFNTWPQAKFYLEHNSVDAHDYLAEHDLYQQKLTVAETVLRPLGPFQRLDRGFLPNYQFAKNDIVIVVGQDGLVANTLKYLDGQPVIGINPEPERWDGLLLPFTVEDLPKVITGVAANSMQTKNITFAEASTNLGQSMLAVNDLFIGPKSHTSARYKIALNDRAEVQSSSGIIVSTGFGSTGWLQSILAGAAGVIGQKGHRLEGGFPWGAKKLQFAVREPFPSHTTGVDIVFGEVKGKNTLYLESFMPEHGVIFSDGIEADAIPFNSGCIASIGVAKKEGVVVC